MCDKMAISAYILKIVEKDPFLRLQMRAKEMFCKIVCDMRKTVIYETSKTVFLGNEKNCIFQNEKVLCKTSKTVF